MHDIFLSYSSRDASQAALLRDALVGGGLTVWHDAENIREMDDIPETLALALDSTRLTVILASAHQYASRVCQWEALKSLALGAERGEDRIAVVTLDDVALDLMPSVKSRRAAHFGGDTASLAVAAAAVRRRLALTSAPVPAAPRATPPVIGLPGTSGGRFIFRLTMLLDLHWHLAGGMRSADAGRAVRQPVVVLHGMGGAGKSCAALFYVEQFGLGYTRGTAWVNVGGDRVDHTAESASERELVFRSAADGLSAWARAIDPSFADREPSLPADPGERWAWLRASLGSWLGADDTLMLVLDDVPDGVDLDELIPNHPRVSVIVTTRDARAGSAGYDVIPVAAFSPVESMLLLTRAVLGERKPSPEIDPWQGQRHLAERLAQLVEHHPLAIDLIANNLVDKEPIASILSEVEDRSEDFFDIAQDVFKMPAKHTPSILATVASSLRGAFRRSTAMETELRLLRALMVLPSGVRAPIDMLEAVLGRATRNASKALGKRSIVTYDGANRTVGCHAITREVARHLWRQEQAPFSTAKAMEPALSHALASALTARMDREGQADVRVGANDALACLAVLDELEDSSGDEQRVQRCEAHQALAREVFRAGLDSLEDCDRMATHVSEAMAAVQPRSSDWLSMAWWSAEAQRGLMLRGRTNQLEVGPPERLDLLKDVLRVLRNAHEARTEISTRMLAEPDGRPSHGWVRRKVSAGAFNLTGTLVMMAQAESALERPDHGLIAEWLDAADKLHGEILELRRQSTPVDWSAIASSVRGHGIVSYHRAMLIPGEDAERLAHLGHAATWLMDSIRVRRDEGRPEDTHDEMDISKSLAPLLKTCWAYLHLDLGADAAKEVSRASVSTAEAEVGRLDCSAAYRPGPVRAGLRSAQQAYRDDQSDAVDRWMPLAREHRVLHEAASDLATACTRWLALAAASPKMAARGLSPSGVFRNFWGTGERPGELRWLSAASTPRPTP